MDEDDGGISKEMETDAQNLSLEEFLRKRGVADETIDYFIVENIDCAAVQIMEEDTLKKWIPRFGDRLAIKNFCKRKIAPKKYSLIEKLREKMAAKNSNVSRNERDNPNKKQKVSRKETRNIELGWLCFNKKEKKLCHVRTNAGGGTRRIAVGKNTTCNEILDKAKDLFFPGGTSVKGALNDFKVSLLDFKQHELNMQLTIQEIFDITLLSKLRFYLSTEYKGHASNGSDTDDINLPSTSTGPAAVDIPFDYETDSHASFSVANVTGHSNELVEFLNGYTPESLDLDIDSLQPNTLPLLGTPINSENGFDAGGYPEIYEELPSTSFISDVMNHSVQDTSTQDTSTQDMILVGNARIGITKKITLHRGKVFDEFLEIYTKLDKPLDYTFQIEMVLPSGQIERGFDAGGVLRDSLTEFWSTFYEKCTIGTDFKIPYLRHDFGPLQWKAVALILYHGWITEKYFPIKISPVFMEQCIVGEVTSDLSDNFLNFVSKVDCDIIKCALNAFSSVDIDEITEIVSTYESKWLPSADNIKRLIHDIAHKELIQKPMFVIKCWTEEIGQLLSAAELGRVYEEQKPTPKNIIKMVTCEDHLTTEMNGILTFLKKFIKEADDTTRAAFLRFCTGADIIINDKLTVTFNTKQGLQRTPVAHTCGNVLELSTTYENFPDFRAEFNSLLSSNVWVMDIV